MGTTKMKSIIGWVMDFSSTHRGYYVASVLLAICGVICSVIPFVLIGNIIRMLLAGEREWNGYLRLIIVIAALWILRVLFHSCSTTLSHKATFQVLANIRRRLLEKLAHLPLGTVLDTPSGSLKNVIVERVDSIETTLAHIVPEFTSNLLVPVFVLVYLLVLDWRMALIALIPLVIGLACYMGMMIGYEASWKNCIEKTKILNDTAVEYINGIEVIKAFGKAESKYERFQIAARESAESFVGWMRRSNVFFTIAMVVTPSTMLTVLPVGGLLVRGGSLAIPDFIQIIILTVGLIQPSITVMGYSDDLAKAMVVIGEVTTILGYEEMERPATSRELPQGFDIALKDVRFSYRKAMDPQTDAAARNMKTNAEAENDAGGKSGAKGAADTEVLHGITMHIKEGTVNALVGPSGSGKSTIAKLIASLWDVDDGAITLGGADLRDMTPDDYNRYIAYVSQDNYLFDLSVRENIRMGNPDAKDSEVEEIAKKSGCHDFILGLENGYDTVCGGAGGHLSGGERQRIAIARAMLKNAPVVILDEATAYTDPENEAVIQQSVAKLVDGKTLIVIAHRLSTIADADRIFVIHDGKLEDEGTHEELLAHDGLYRRMWEAHISVRDAA